MGEAAKKNESETTEGRPQTPHTISPISKELIIGLVGFAGAGCSQVADTLTATLLAAGYDKKNIHHVKLSQLIERRFPKDQIPQVEEGAKKGNTKFARACKLQNLGDSLRSSDGDHVVSSLAAKEIIRRRGDAEHGEEKIAFILDSIKHYHEVDLLRRVYDKTFRLIAVHCERSKREARLIGKTGSKAKYAGVPADDVCAYLDRDEKDKDNKHGQQVRDAFYHADYFLDNNNLGDNGLSISGDIERFVDLVLGKNLVRPKRRETGMFYAQAAALRSSCLSRQVGAALEDVSGRIVASGANEVPQYGGGVYSADVDESADGRCFAWQWINKKDANDTFCGCHNTRLKRKLREDIAKWLGKNFSQALALAAHPINPEMDVAFEAREKAAVEIAKLFESVPDKFEEMPGIKDIIEYSRSIHAEMNTLFNASSQGVSPVNGVLYSTTFPCHNCARHLVTAGIKVVYYIEPFVKSLASELHSDSIATETNDAGKNKMFITPFTGVGPRMYEEYFAKKTDLKDDATGEYKNPEGGVPSYAVRLREMASVEKAAADLVKD